jgi:hypothetical protein
MTMRAPLLPALCLLAGGVALASDHAEADGVNADPIGDLDDLYAWEAAGGKITVIVTFGGPQTTGPGVASTLDDDLIYGVHVDTTGDGVAEHDVWVRFGQDPGGAWGVQLSGIPGGNPVVTGPVQTALDAGNGLQAEAGLFDDPFFMDFTGYNDTLATERLMFRSDRDTFGGKNVNAIVFEMDGAALGADSFTVWATSGRKP